MKMRSRVCCFAVLGATLVAGGPALAQWETQTISLNPGWNAVFLEVTPVPETTAEVFAGVPVESVWTWNRRFNEVQFIQDPEQLAPEQEEWLTFYPPDSEQSFLTNLFVMPGATAYLVKLGGGQPVTWTVKGAPALRPPNWLANSFSLVGFHLSDDAGVSVADFFAPSTAHAGQEVYALSPAGRWAPVDGSSPMQRGKAYWVYTQGQSQYAGPLGVRLEADYALDYGRSVNERDLVLRNNRNAAVTVTLQARVSENPPDAGQPLLAGSVPLSYFLQDLSQEILRWEPLPNPFTVEIPARGEVTLRLGVRRTDMDPFEPPGEGVEFLYQSLLEIRDSQGLRYRVPVRARGRSTGDVIAKRLNEKDELELLFADENRGLWYGYVSINKVSEPYNANPAVGPFEPQPTASEFTFPLLVHVDNDGQARLLREVIVMWQDGTTRPDPDDPSARILDTPGRYVLVTSDDLIPQFRGAALRDGILVGRRMSSPAFSHDAPAPLLGEFGAALTTDPASNHLTLAHDHDLNPFKHRYHPDHNMQHGRETIRSDGSQAFLFSVTRELELNFTASDPESNDTVRWGDSVWGGVYREAIIGIHREIIYIEGVFRLNKVLDVGVLNDDLD